ncbi:hypothetical protein [Frankia gtarii]|nr:hypothetical protein [Frankia gtarii]
MGVPSRSMATGLIGLSTETGLSVMLALLQVDSAPGLWRELLAES